VELVEQLRISLALISALAVTYALHGSMQIHTLLAFKSNDDIVIFRRRFKRIETNKPLP
jgi:hypothetical protein